MSGNDVFAFLNPPPTVPAAAPAAVAFAPEKQVKRAARGYVANWGDDLTEVEKLTDKLANDKTKYGRLLNDFLFDKRKFDDVRLADTFSEEKYCRLSSFEIAKLKRQEISDDEAKQWLFLDTSLHCMPKEIVQMIREFLTECASVYWPSVSLCGPMKIWRWCLQSKTEPTIPARPRFSATCVVCTKEHGFRDNQVRLSRTDDQSGSFYLWMNSTQRLFYFDTLTRNLHSFPKFESHDAPKCAHSESQHLVAVTRPPAEPSVFADDQDTQMQHSVTVGLYLLNPTTGRMSVLSVTHPRRGAPTVNPAGWQDSVPYPYPALHLSACAANRLLIVSGGAHGGVNGNDAVRTCMAFIPEQHQWVRLPDLPVALHSHSMLYLGGQIVVMHGTSDRLDAWRYYYVTSTYTVGASTEQFYTLPFDNSVASRVIKTNTCAPAAWVTRDSALPVKRRDQSVWPVNMSSVLVVDPHPVENRNHRLRIAQPYLRFNGLLMDSDLSMTEFYSQHS